MEVQVDGVNAAADVMNNLAAVRNSLDATVTVTAFRMNDTAAVVLAYPHCGVDGHKQDYSLDAPLASQRKKDSPVQRVPVALSASSVAPRSAALAAAPPMRRKEPSWSFKWR